MKRGSLFKLAVWSALGILLLAGLGVWQLFRLQEKHAYLANLEERLTAPPVSLEQALTQAEAGSDVEFLKVEANGSFAGDNLYKQATIGGGPGWQVLTPFHSSDGAVVLVDRGTAPADMRGDALEPPQGIVTTQGIVRRHNRGQGLFDPENDPSSGTWYWWDIPAMLGSLQIEQDAKVAPFILQALPQQSDQRFPVAESLATGIPNNHLQYALTWFALALCLAAVAGILGWRQAKDHRA